ncbi:sugar nucleotide-binding protein [Candidatus Micrarchaeota archaeon]|nr:sugar nucleotide-binding protein [Candidatus Micrarchaeota archaeon]
MKCLVLGASGLVGRYTSELLRKNCEVITASRSAPRMDFLIDASVYEEAEHLIKTTKPDAVVNLVKCRMSTDRAEIEKTLAWESNVMVPENLARLQNIHDFHLIHISSDWVYEGKEGEEYDESALMYPLNFYSFTKAVAEEKISCIAKKYAILRPGSIFGFEQENRNFFMRLKDAVESNQSFAAATDQCSHPIYAKHLAEMINAALEKRAQGIFNAVGKDYVSRYELAVRICDSFGWQTDAVHPTSSSQRKIRIPSHLRLSIQKTEKQLLKVKNLNEQIDELKAEITI